MLVNPRIAAYLGRALSHEMNAVQMYLTQAKLCELWGMQERAEQLRRDAGEELDHAGRLISRMLTLGLLPNGTQLNPARPGRDPHEMLELDWHLEAEAVRLYDEAVRYCERNRDPETAQLFMELMKDEQEHLACLDRLLASSQHQSGRS